MEKAIRISLILFFAVILTNCSDYCKHLGRGYYYNEEGGDNVSIFCERGDYDIPPTVISYNYNKFFIIAKQKPKLPQDILYTQEFNYKYGENAIYFWIILKKEDIVFGPMDSLEYIKTRKELNVSEKLKLE